MTDMTEQTDAAEVEALAREMFDLSGTPENWWVDHRKGYEQHAREIIRSDWLAAREAAAEARGAERALREAAREVQRVINHWSSVPSDVLEERGPELADLEACRDIARSLPPEGSAR